MIVLDIDKELEGDIYFRIYHIKDEKQPNDTKANRKFMFRFSVHTGFVPSGAVLRLTKTELDDAIKSGKYNKDFFVDLLWQKVEPTSTPTTTTTAAKTFATDLLIE